MFGLFDRKDGSVKKQISLGHCLFLLVLTAAVFYFLFTAFYCYFSPKYGFLFLGLFSGLLVLWQFLSVRLKNADHAAMVLMPLFFLLFWDPSRGLSLFFPLTVVFFSQAAVYVLLSGRLSVNNGQAKALVFGIATAYFLSFAALAVYQYDNLIFFNPKDFGLFNQTFWNALHGRIFENSAYGSIFASHNTQFFFLLVPAYYFFPHPLTLMLLKTLFLSLAVIPFYLIAKDYLEGNARVLSCVSFLCFPYLISLNLIPPHEICFAPFFVLFTTYFFLRKRFMLFLGFLILTLSIKEHLIFLAVMFGLLAVFERRKWMWGFFSLLLAFAWAVFSVAIMSYFQQAYSHPEASWFSVYLQNNFSGQGLLLGLKNLILLSKFGSWASFLDVRFLFLPLLILPPLLSPLALLGAPEILMNLLSDSANPLLLPPWHYNVISSCFLVLATLPGLRKLSVLNIGNIDSRKRADLLSLFILTAVILHAFLWLNLLKGPHPQAAAIKQAIRIIPPRASVTVISPAIVPCSSRPDYSLINESPEKLGEYLILDEQTQSLESDKEDLYQRIFEKQGIVVMKQR